METLKQEVMRGHKCTEHVVVDDPSYVVSLLKFSTPREFIVCSAESKGNFSRHQTDEIFACLTEFIKNNPEDAPCYCLLDVTRTDVFTLQQLQTASAAFGAVRSYLETRLVGTVVKVGDEQFNDGFLTAAFKRLYTPVRPVRWYTRPGDGAGFITEWEERLR